MIRIALLIIAASFANRSFAQKSIEANSEIKSATIYLQGAVMVMHSTVNVPAGSNDIVFTELPQNINAGTVQVSANTDITILSAVYQLNYLNTKKENAQIKTLKDSLDLLNIQLKKTQGQKNIVKGQADLLNANKNVTGQNTGLNMDQLTKMYEFYTTKMNDLNSQQLDLEQKEKKLNENIQRVQNQLNELNSKFNQPTGEIVVSVSSAAARSTTFEFSFLMPDAGWSPIYDIRSKDIHSQVTLNYKANVYQNSGSDWNDVKIKLSTGNPTVSATGPTLYPWYVNIYQPQQLNEVIISAPSRAAAGKQKEPVPAQAEDSFVTQNWTGADYTTVTQTQLNAEFDISIPYDIPSDGKTHLVAIQDYQLPATYSYYAVPKMDNDAFLTADISNWEDLKLLPGNANIFFEGSYVGQSYVNPSVTKDTLSFSLGRDKNIIIKRDKVKDFSKPKLTGDNIKQSFAYTITIKNTKKETVNMKIMDQIPVSQNSKIEVTLDDAGGASFHDAEGKLTWMVPMAAGEEKKLQFSFTVKYPKDVIISGL